MTVRVSERAHLAILSTRVQSFAPSASFSSFSFPLMNADIPASLRHFSPSSSELNKANERDFAVAFSRSDFCSHSLANHSIFNLGRQTIDGTPKNHPGPSRLQQHCDFEPTENSKWKRGDGEVRARIAIGIEGLCVILLCE